MSAGHFINTPFSGVLERTKSWETVSTVLGARPKLLKQFLPRSQPNTLLKQGVNEMNASASRFNNLKT